MEKFTNALIHQTSPYLLQHAHNPVNWVAWSDEVFAQAKQENKLILISSGYSACHWCHVMEHECFEDEEVAALMNRHFIAIKVDREERPDVDQVYMTAVQLMTQQGGWPLNCFTLPDGRPVYGGTYFPKEKWMHILTSLQRTFTDEPQRMEEYASQLHEGIKASELITAAVTVEPFEEEKLHELVLRWSHNFDSVEGGTSRAPKFPLPSNYLFLLHYGVHYEHSKVLKNVELTLDKMAMGGIYDQIGGGFSRYSVDVLWKVPHFEKMLYDNAQLIELYSHAFAHFKKPLYKRIVFQTVEWLQREMLTNEGAFYAALDADSEGEEGKFYCWTPEELTACLGDEAHWGKEYYSIGQRGYWEEGKYILLRSTSDHEFAQKMGWTPEEFEQQTAALNQQLLSERSRRIRPGLDNKCLTSWNAMTLKALCTAYTVFQEEEFLYLALKNARWMEKHQLHPEGKLAHNYTNGTATIDGFLEDYAHVIDAFTALYEVTFDAHWVELAKQLTTFTRTHFQDPTSNLFYFTDASSTLIARKMELTDNVIPASNSVMARNLFRLAAVYQDASLHTLAEAMLASVYDGMERYGSGYSNWATLLLQCVTKQYQVVITGENALPFSQQMRMNRYLPHVQFIGGKPSELPALKDKHKEGATVAYICYEGTCLLPTEKVEEALKGIR
jgi:uncharacterized protein YyaL (SSP411 family)